MATEYFPVFMDELILPDSSDETLPDELPMHRVIEMALDAARGLQALHEAPGGPIVHADLQPRQLLLDENGVVKVNDLNRCRFMGRDAEGNYCPFRISKGNGVWRSPEEYQGAVSAIRPWHCCIRTSNVNRLTPRCIFRTGPAVFASTFRARQYNRRILYQRIQQYATVPPTD